MGISWQVGSAEGFVNVIPRRFDQFMNEAADAVERVIQEGARLQRENIDRILTGRMRGSVGYEMKTTSGAVIEGEFGWTEDQEAYFLYQEEGTRFIAPMHALSEAGSEVRARLIKYIAQAADRAWS